MHYTNHDTRQQLQPAAIQPEPQQFLSLERGRRGFCLRVRTAATVARRKLEPFKLPGAAAAIILAAALALFMPPSFMDTRCRACPGLRWCNAALLSTPLLVAFAS